MAHQPEEAWPELTEELVVQFVVTFPGKGWEETHRTGTASSLPGAIETAMAIIITGWPAVKLDEYGANIHLSGLMPRIHDCPKCGATALDDDTHYGYNILGVEIGEDVAMSCKCHTQTKPWPTLFEAIHAWNRGEVQSP